MFTKKSKAKSQKPKVATEAFFLLASFFFSLDVNAQCAMCRAVLETEEGGVKAEAVNDGIVYLMAFPYILVGILGYVIYRTRQKKKV
ncbi:hypothetical protein J2X31_000464 [Flavobacterium arsenatis]|uniref:Uncharacterized protein n=1 Tax=Flavobacterium arsenatis TaxID=1484332 RepID=A0ABU1TKK1_9FLAO|nr:hypothetical protein [Flavobacterium arsenatis]MDR6966471.1 hypothetical protein [Flavobacterium arsenatis]